MSYRGVGDATTAGEIPDAWTQRKAAEFNAAMARASGMGAVVPMFRPSRPIAIPDSHTTRLDTSQARLDTSRGRLDTRYLKPPFGTVDPASPEPPPVGPTPIVMMIGWGAVVAVAAGIFWAVSRPGSRTVTANKRRRRRSNGLRRNRGRRSRRNTSEIVVRYGQSSDHRTPFYENWFSDGSRGKLTSTSDMSSAKHEADRVVATLQKRGFSARTRKESLTWANPRRKTTKRRKPKRKMSRLEAMCRAGGIPMISRAPSAAERKRNLALMANPRRKTTKRRLRLPTRAEVKKANAGTVAQRRALARKYGLSGYAAAAVGLKSSPLTIFDRKRHRRRRSRK